MSVGGVGSPQLPAERERVLEITEGLLVLSPERMEISERAEIASGATGKAMGGFRQQFSTEAEVRLAQESAKLFRELGPPLFEAIACRIPIRATTSTRTR